MKKAMLIVVLGLVNFSIYAQTAELKQIRKENLEKRNELQEGRNPKGTGIRDTKLEKPTKKSTPKKN